VQPGLTVFASVVNPLTSRGLAIYCAAVKHITIAEKSLLVGDAVADALVRHAPKR
jgi:hypothetical protein